MLKKLLEWQKGLSPLRNFLVKFIVYFIVFLSVSLLFEKWIWEISRPWLQHLTSSIFQAAVFTFIFGCDLKQIKSLFKAKQSD